MGALNNLDSFHLAEIDPSDPPTTAVRHLGKPQNIGSRIISSGGLLIYILYIDN